VGGTSSANGAPANGTPATATPNAFPSLDTGPATGGLIAFVWRRPAQKTNGLATIHADGTARTEIPDTKDATEPALSPDRSRIAYTNGGTKPGIWTMNLDGSDRHLVAHVAGANAQGPAWSPDGTKIAFVAVPSANGEGAMNPSDIWIVDADGSHLTKLTGSASGDRPAWSPDGKKVAYSSAVGSGIYVVVIAGGGVAPVTGGGDLSPAWAPDDRRLAFQRQDDSDPAAVVSHIFVVFSDGTNLEQLTQGTTDDEYASWAPDGRGLVYAQFVATSNGGAIADLVILGGNGVSTNLTNTPDVSEFLPSWR
jgi:TolB protein